MRNTHEEIPSKKHKAFSRSSGQVRQLLGEHETRASFIVVPALVAV